MKRDLPESGAQPTIEERRAALWRARREAARVVKRTLLAIAVIAGGYYLWLLSRDRKKRAYKDELAPSPTSSNETTPR